MYNEGNNVLLISMPFASIELPSIQLSILAEYLHKRGIQVKQKHHYLHAADIYGINNYNSLVLPPNDSYTAQIIFSKYLFPIHWNQNRKKIKDYYQKNQEKNPNKQFFSFKKFENKTDHFFNYVLNKFNWRSYDLIGFTLNYGQFLPSLALAKQIKKKDPTKIIILGGSRTTGILGKRTLDAFEFIDFIVSGEGEEALFQLAHNPNCYTNIPGLIYRKNNEIKWNTEYKAVKLESQSLPNYDEFYHELSTTSSELQQFFRYYGRLPIEISRGCWWNKCTFCNLNLQYPHYREKTIDTIVKEIDHLSEKYKQLSFQIIGNTLPKDNLQEFLTKIIALKKDFNFYAEARADTLKKEDYYLLKQAGFTTIQTGIESFSQHYLKKMNKGTNIIYNIAALKHCKENHIKNPYNLIINYPNEEVIDFQESKQVINQIKEYLDPPQLCQLRVVYGSQIQQHPEIFNINKFDYITTDKLMIPNNILTKNFNFIFDYIPAKPSASNEWKHLIQTWKDAKNNKNTNNTLFTENLIFFYVDGGSFLTIYDKRDTQGNIQIITLNQEERQVFLGCLDVISYDNLKTKIQISESELQHILLELKDAELIFEDDQNRYLSLPISYSNFIGNNQISEEKLQDLEKLEFL